MKLKPTIEVAKELCLMFDYSWDDLVPEFQTEMLNKVDEIRKATLRVAKVWLVK